MKANLRVIDGGVGSAGQPSGFGASPPLRRTGRRLRRERALMSQVQMSVVAIGCGAILLQLLHDPEDEWPSLAALLGFGLAAAGSVFLIASLARYRLVFRAPEARSFVGAEAVDRQVRLAGVCRAGIVLILVGIMLVLAGLLLGLSAIVQSA